MDLTYFLDMFGVAVFAVAGTLAAGAKRMDIFGVVVVAQVTANGGGTLRDLVLGVQPVFWVADPLYIVIAGIFSLATFFWVRIGPSPGRLLLYCDAFGLAMFNAIGVHKALSLGHGAIIAVLMGMMTGVAGGMIRDILCGEIPLILHKEFYATAALAGGVAMVGLSNLGVGPDTVMLVGVAVTLVIRLAAIRWGFALPVFPNHSGDE